MTPTTMNLARHLLLLAGLVSLAKPGASQELLKDINATPVPPAPYSATYFDPGIIAGSRMVFTADEDIYGAEPWVTDGTPEGTDLLRDIAYGDSSSRPGNYVKVSDGTFYFRARGMLWHSDGTPRGTQSIDQAVSTVWSLGEISGELIYAIDPETRGVYELRATDVALGGTRVVADLPGDLRTFSAVHNGVLYFVVGFGEDLWRTDGTTAGTYLLKDINPTRSSRIGQMYVAGSYVYFLADDGTAGLDLWRTDGTSTGTIQLLDVPVGSRGYSELTPFNDLLVFVTDDGVAGEELWRSDGTVNGTIQLLDIEPGPSGSQPTALTPVGGALMFVANTSAAGQEPWRTDGTTAGTTLVKDINLGATGSTAGPLTAFGNRVYFMANDGVSGRELWSSDGTAVGTSLLYEFVPGSGSGSIFSTSAGQSLMYFVAFSVATGSELWRTDGTTAGTFLLRDIRPGGQSSNIEQLGVVNAKHVFVATDSVHGQELWVSDGSPAGTVLLRDISPPVASSSFPSEFASIGDHVLFAASTQVGDELWISDGTPSGTQLLRDIHPQAGSDVEDMVSMGGSAFFLATDLFARNVWRSDGTSAGTSPITDFWIKTPEWLTVVDDTLFFAVREFFFGTELWTSDGTRAGTRMVAMLYTSHTPSLGERTTVAGRLFFPFLNTLWVSDGTTAGTGEVVASGSSYQRPDEPQGIVDVNGVAVFSSDSIFTGREIWRSDGTPAGTRLIADINVGGRDSDPTWLTALGSGVIFVADDGGSGVELWRSDLTAPGTVLVKDIRPGPESSNPRYLIETGGRVYFVADDGVRGQELWCTDGTEAGTYLVRDIAAGPAWGIEEPFGAEGLSLAGSGGAVLFRANDGTGSEPWASDGTAAGTVQVADLSPGGTSSSPEGFALAGTEILFAARHPSLGIELWKLPLTATGGSLVAEFGSACTGPGTTELEVTSNGIPSPSNARFALVLEAAPSIPGACLISASRASLPLPGGCTLHPAAPIAIALSTTSAGQAQLPIRPSAAWFGLPIYAQFITVESGGALYSAVNLSRGVRLVVGR